MLGSFLRAQSLHNNVPACSQPMANTHVQYRSVWGTGEIFYFPLNNFLIRACLDQNTLFLYFRELFTRLCQDKTSSGHPVACWQQPSAQFSWSVRRVPLSRWWWFELSCLRHVLVPEHHSVVQNFYIRRNLTMGPPDRQDCPPNPALPAFVQNIFTVFPELAADILNSLPQKHPFLLSGTTWRDRSSPSPSQRAPGQLQPS